MFECVVGLSVTSLSHLALKVPLLPLPSLEAAFALLPCPTWNINWICERCRRNHDNCLKISPLRSLPIALLRSSNPHPGMGLSILFTGGAGIAWDGWWGYRCRLPAHLCCLEAGMSCGWAPAQLPPPAQHCKARQNWKYWGRCEKLHFSHGHFISAHKIRPSDCMLACNLSCSPLTLVLEGIKTKFYEVCSSI